MTLDELDAATPEATAEWNRIARDNWIYTVTLFALSHTPEGDLLSLGGTGKLESIATLEGVAFYAFDVQRGAGMVRCHELESVNVAMAVLSQG